MSEHLGNRRETCLRRLCTRLRDQTPKLSRRRGNEVAQNPSERVDIRPLVGAAGADLFRCHVAFRTAPCRRATRRGQPEVADDGEDTVAQQNISRLEVQMQNVPIVCGTYSLADAPEDAERLFRWDRTTSETLAERAAPHVFHDDNPEGGRRRRVVDTTDVRVRDVDGEAHLLNSMRSQG